MRHKNGNRVNKVEFFSKTKFTDFCLHSPSKTNDEEFKKQHKAIGKQIKHFDVRY